MENVGYIGLGNMGSGMAANLQEAGYNMVVHDLREGATRPYLEKGARLGNSPADVAERCDVVFTSLPGPKEVEAVALGANGILEGIKPGCVYVDMSTSRPTLIREIEPKFREKGAYVMDAPVSGGKSGAASGNLAIMVGGPREIFDKIKPMYDAMGDKVFYAGETGAGAIAKLVHNMTSHGIRMAIAEGLTLGVKAGVETEALWECVRRGALGRMSYLHENLPSKVFRDQYDPTFALELSFKDITLATELGREFNVPMPIANLGLQRAMEAMNRGWGHLDSTIIFKLQEEASGVEVRAPQVDPQKSARFISTHPDVE